LASHSKRLFENRLLRKIFGPKSEKVARGCRRLHNEELHKFYASPNIIRVVKSGRMRWAEHVASMGEKKNPYKILVGKSDGKRYSADPGVDGKIV
jgi:hypothetical protein